MNTKELFEQLEKWFSLLDSEVVNEQGKNVIEHSKRIYQSLKNDGYSDDICIAGLFHDVIEDTPVTQDDIRSIYGSEVGELVECCTKNEDLQGEACHNDIITKCRKKGIEALVIYTYDNLDSYKFYRSIQLEPELERCRKKRDIMWKYLTDDEKNSLKHLVDQVV